LCWLHLQIFFEEAQTMDWALWKTRFRDWLVVRQFASDTVHGYLSNLEPFLDFVEALALSSWTEVSRDVVEEYRSHVFYQKHRRNGQALKVSTQVHRLVAIKSFFKFLVREGYLLANPTSELELPRTRRALPAVLSEAEMLKLLEVPDVQTLWGMRDRTLMETLYGTGLRNSELCSLTLDQVDLVTHTVRLQKGKGNKGRVMPLGQEAQHWIEIYLEKVRPQLLRSPNVQALFLDRWGHAALTRNGLDQTFQRLSKKAGLGKNVTPHILRHSCATHMLRHGASLRHIQELLGHASLTSTEHYTRVEISDLRKVIAKCHPREQI
jgi:integrase/recombinase XerD